MPSKNKPGCNCCGNICTIFSDSFTRADAMTPGSDWTVVSGAWHIASNKLTAFTAPGIAIINTAHPDGGHQAHITATIVAGSNLQTARLIFDYVDSSNYHYAEIAWGTLNSNADGHLKFFKRTSGSDVQKGSTWQITGLNAGDTATLSLCFHGPYVEATINGISGNAVTTAHGGDQVGVGSGSAGVTWDDYVYSHVASEGGNYTACPDCTTTLSCSACSGTATPSEYKVVLAGIANGSCSTSNCGSLNGTWVVEMNGVPAVGLTVGAGNCVGTTYTGLTNCGVSINSWYVALGVGDADGGAGTDYLLEVAVGAVFAGFQYGLFRKDYNTTLPDCASLVDEPLAFTTDSSANCDFTSATCFVTAI